MLDALLTAAILLFISSAMCSGTLFTVGQS
jgi:hypothetical protein